ncbi:MAG TPA: hypothetical protein VIV35_10110 [Chitinophagaceae bacterium]
MYHPLWKPSKFNSATNTLFQVESESTVKVGDSYKTRTSEFNNSFPLFDKYKYEHFRLNLSINHDMSFEAKLAEFKKWNKNENPKMFDFVNNSGKKGKIITLNYLHEGTGIWKYELYAIIATDVKDSYLYCMMDFLCHPIGNVASGVQATDEAAFRQWATAYLETFVSK